MNVKLLVRLTNLVEILPLSREMTSLEKIQLNDDVIDKKLSSTQYSKVLKNW